MGVEFFKEQEMESVDIIMGVEFLMHLKTYCENCGIYKTPQWRKGIIE